MSTDNICFHGEIRKVLCGYPFLSRDTLLVINKQYPVILQIYRIKPHSFRYPRKCNSNAVCRVAYVPRTGLVESTYRATRMGSMIPWKTRNVNRQHI